MGTHHVKPPWLHLGLAFVVVLVVGSLCSCAPRLPGAGVLQSGHAAALTWAVTEWLALVAGFAAIVVAVVFAFLKEYTAGVAAALGCMGLCALFLVLPTVVSFVKWFVLASLVSTLAGVGYMAVTRIRHPDATLPSLLCKLKKSKPLV